MPHLMDLYARTHSDRSTRWRRHAFAWLAPEPALAYEPQELRDGERGVSPLTITRSSAGFEWRGRSHTVRVQWIRRRQEIDSEDFAPSGSLPWTRTAGCEAIDLTPLDSQGPAGEACRIAPPIEYIGRPSVAFDEEPGNRVTIWTQFRELKNCSVALWKRHQTNDWQRKGEYGPIGEGIPLPIPKDQGAFVVFDQHAMEEICFFYDGGLLPSSPSELKQLAIHYVVREFDPNEDIWPSWIETKLIAAVEKRSGGATISRLAPEEPLRQNIRQILLGPYLPPGFGDWRPELSIEEFATGHWPLLEPVLKSDADEKAIADAFHWRKSPLLEEATRLAAGRRNAYGALIRVSPVRQTQRELEKTLTPGPTREANVTLGKVLEDCTAAPERTEMAVFQQWRDLQHAYRKEFGRDIDLPDALQ